MIEFQGDQNILTVSTKLGVLKIITDTEKQFLTNAEIGLIFDPKKVALFDTQTEKTVAL